MTLKAAPLTRTFFDRPALEVARELLDCRLCRTTPAGVVRWQITETEAYDGPEDRASHARAGRTARTAIMFGPAGVWYVYLCYGIHSLLNIVTGPENYPAAILIRGAGEIKGPGRLTRALGIDRSLNARRAHPDAGLWIERGESIGDAQVERTPRIGIDYAGPDWAHRHYRFVRK